MENFEEAPLRRFELRRVVDATGVSGTGIVATGVMWPDGKCALRWMTQHRSTTLYDSIDDVEKIHGHAGGTKIDFVDDEGPHEWLCYRCGGGTNKGGCVDCGSGGTTAIVPKWFGDATREENQGRFHHAYRMAADRARDLATAIQGALSLGVQVDAPTKLREMADALADVIKQGKGTA